MLKSILKVLFGSSPANKPTRSYRDSFDHDELVDDDLDDDDLDDDEYVSFWVGGRRISTDGQRQSTGERNWWSYKFPPNRPRSGPWRISQASVEVAGTQHRLDNVRTFVREVQTTERQRKLDQFSFSLHLEFEPTNVHDSNAVKVIGKTGVYPSSRLLGYLPRKLAAELSGFVLPPIEAARYFERSNYSELKINLLEQMPTRVETLADDMANLEGMDMRAFQVDHSKAPSEYIDIARRLKRVGRVDDAATVLEKLTDTNQSGQMAPPGAWKDLAIIYRQRKDYTSEVVLLERFLSGPFHAGRTGKELFERLSKARELKAMSED